MGEPPSGAFDYVIVLIAVIAVALTVSHAAIHLLHPGEASPEHIKRRILDDEDPPSTPIEDALHR